MLLLILHGKEKFHPTGNGALISRVTVKNTNHCTTRSSHGKWTFQSYFNVKPTIITLNISHHNKRCLGDVLLYTLYPILTLSRSTSLTSGLFCDRCLHNHVSRNASRTHSCFDLSLCLLNRTRRNHHSFYCKSIAETVHCNWHVSIDVLTSLGKAVLTCKSLKVGLAVYHLAHIPTMGPKRQPVSARSIMWICVYNVPTRFFLDRSTW